LQVFQALDFLVLQGITAASVSSDFHTMCNGANLAYKRSAFQAVNGFEGIDRVATGDDMLLMHKIRKLDPSKVHYLKSQDAIVNTEPMPSWKAFFMQRKRWASKTLVYDDYRIIAVLGFVYLLNCLFPILIITSIFNPVYWWYVLFFWILKTIIEFPFVNSVAKFYNEQKLMKYFFFFQPLHMLYTVSVGLLSQFGKYEWKGRKTK
jgi:cellulose synthase/poly-beta-1,6-N-acetylglucosamine synthase-like glycosyltransferase